MKTDNLKRLSIEISSHCNYKCAGCPSLNLPRGKGHMDSEMFAEIFKETGDSIEKVFLWGYGEPLLHPKIGNLLNIAGKYPCMKVLSTNGSRLEDFQDLDMLRNLDELIISINGFTQEVYCQHQEGGDLNKVLRGVRKTANSLQDFPTRLILQAVAHKGNIQELEKGKEMARDLGFDEFVVKSFNVMDQKKETYDLFVPDEARYSRYPQGFKKSLPSPSRSGVYPCERWMVINWDGSANPCCWDYQGVKDLGNVIQSGVYAVWNSQKAKDHREAIRAGKFSGFCTDCSNSKTIFQEGLTAKGKLNSAKSI